MEMEKVETAEEQKLQAKIWKHVYGFVDSLVLRSAIELRIFDILHSEGGGTPMTPSQLATALSPRLCDPGNLRRLLSYLTSMGLLAIKRKSLSSAAAEEAYFLTGLGEFLLTDGEKSLAKWALAIINQTSLRCWHDLSRSCCSANAEMTPFERIHGISPWALAGESEELNQVINEAMASDTRLAVPAFIEGCKEVFQGVGSIVDVGGGTGTAMRLIGHAFPHIQCIVFDLPHVVASASPSPAVTMVGGDMFESVPSADAVLLKFMLHNFEDDDCIKILGNCKKAIPEEGGKVIILDIVMDSETDDKDLAGARICLDIDLMAVSGGRERTEEEWERLLSKAGFLKHEFIRIPAIQSAIVAYP